MLLMDKQKRQKLGEVTNYTQKFQKLRAVCSTMYFQFYVKENGHFNLLAYYLLFLTITCKI